MGALGLALAACGGGGGGTPAAQGTPLELVSAAAGRTTAAHTAMVALRTETRGGTTTNPLDGKELVGSFDFVARRGSFSTSVKPLGKIEVAMIAGTIFMHVPKFSEVPQTEGRTWVRLDFERLGEIAGVQGLGKLVQSSTGDPGQGLGYLQGVSGSVERVGSQEVRGTTTTHYKLVTDLNLVAERSSDPEVAATNRQVAEILGTPTIPVEVWLDKQGRVRRILYRADYSKASFPNVPKSALPTSATSSADFFDFGTSVHASAPPDRETMSFDELLDLIRQAS